MMIKFTPTDLLLFTGMAVTIVSFWLMFRRRASERRAAAAAEALDSL